MLQQAWNEITGSLSPQGIYRLIYFVGLIVFWSVGLAFLAIDIVRPTWALYFKCQPEKHVSKEDIGKVVCNVLTNQVTTNFAVFLLLWPIADRRLSFSKELPPATTLLWTLPAYALLTEVLFYYIHRALHIPQLYKRFHKIHHEIKAPFAICSIYMHPVEHALSVLEGVTPALVLKSHVSLLGLWMCMATFNIQLHHCGYDWEPYWPDSLKPFFASMTHQHDYHHYAFNKCFGVIGVLDWLHGTDGGLKEHMQQWERTRS